MAKAQIKKIIAAINNLEDGNSFLCTEAQFSDLFPYLYNQAFTGKFGHALVETPEKDYYRIWIHEQKQKRLATLNLNRLSEFSITRRGNPFLVSPGSRTKQ